MTANSKRRYILIAVVLLMLFSGWILLAVRAGRSVSMMDLEEYAQNLLRGDSTLTRRDIAMVYALGLRNHWVHFDTPKRFVFHSFLNQERVEIQDEPPSTASSDNRDWPPICSLVYSGGKEAQVYGAPSSGQGSANTGVEQGELRRAAMVAYLFLSKQTKLEDQFTLSVGRIGVSYWAIIARWPPTPGGHTTVEMSQDFKRIELIPGY